MTAYRGWVRTGAMMIGAIALSATLSGCAWRGAVTVDCDNFVRDYARAVPPSALVAAIQSEVVGGPGLAAAAPLVLKSGPGQLTETVHPGDEAIIRRIVAAAANSDKANAATDRSPAMLILSGGGQWGAFGAGYLKGLHDRDPASFPRAALLTGVSTGALQALFIAAGQATGEEAKWFELLHGQYTPERESDVVIRRSQPMAVFNGSVATLGPLRQRIEQALCPRDGDCPLLRALAAPTAPQVLIGFVEANSGEMLFVDVNQIARDGATNPAAAQQCLTGAALASVAMPYQFQQVRIRSRAAPGAPLVARTYYDGGVRQSVFIANADALHRKAVARAGVKVGAAPRRIYVIRNGPTSVTTSDAPDRRADVLTAAERGYALIVNQTEVTSIAAIRQTHATGDIFLATADGYDRFAVPPGISLDGRKDVKGGAALADPPTCASIKRDGWMFDPDFMACLRALGAAKAARPASHRWITLPEALAKD